MEILTSDDLSPLDFPECTPTTGPDTTYSPSIEKHISPTFSVLFCCCCCCCCGGGGGGGGCGSGGGGGGSLSLRSLIYLEVCKIIYLNLKLVSISKKKKKKKSTILLEQVIAMPIPTKEK